MRAKRPLRLPLAPQKDKEIYFFCLPAGLVSAYRAALRGSSEKSSSYKLVAKRRRRDKRLHGSR